MSDKKARDLPKKTEAWIDELLAAAKLVAATDKKMEFYHQARREAPEVLSLALRAQESDLEARVKKLLTERESLKEDIFNDGRFDSNMLREVEFSYQKAVCFCPGKARAFSRMFFLPCVYWSKADGGGAGVIDFAGDMSNTFADFVCAFLDEHFGHGQNQTPKVTALPGSLMEWMVLDEEEKMLPALHRAIIHGSPIEMDQAFPTRARAIAESDSAGWAVGVLAFAVEHDDEAWLESISFEGYEDDFLEGFEEIFDPSSKLDYDCPCDPTMIQDESVRLLWMKQVEITVAEMVSTKNAKQIGVVETTFVWEDGNTAGVMMDFKVIDPDADNGNDTSEVLYHRQVSRPILVDEEPRDLAAFLIEYPPLMREDFDIVFGHQFETSVGKLP